MKRTEISLPDVIRILFKRKIIIISAIVISIFIAILYNFLRKPIYQSSVLLKKELILDDKGEGNPLTSLLAIRSQDELETDMQLAQTRSVINKTIEELCINLTITKIIEQDGTVTKINLPLSEYKNNYSLGNYPNYFPKINKIYLGLKTTENEFKLKQVDNEIILTDDKSKNVFNSEVRYSDISPKEWVLDIDWEGENLSEIHFKTLEYNSVYENILENTFTDKKVKTNIFELGVRSNFPFTTKLIANTLTDKFKEIRITQQKDNIRYTYEFIDERLNEVAKNLEAAEDSLSAYKATEQLVQIDEQSRKLVEFISNLESEKLKTDLDLTLYRNKLNSIQNEMRTSGYVDQTYLTPEQYQSTNSPFSNLLDELSRLELRKIELTQKRTKMHPDVILLTDQINNIKNELTKYNNNTLIAYNIITNALDNRQIKLDNLILKYSSNLEKLPKQEATLAGLVRKKDALEKMYNLLFDKREEMKVAELSKMQDIIVLDPAIEPIKPIYPNKKLNLLFAALFGLIAGIFGAIITQTYDTTITDVSEIESTFDYPILSVIPPFEKKTLDLLNNSEVVKERFITMMDEKYNYKEAYRTIETKLVTKIKGSPKKVMITSCEENAGKTTIATNLAITMAQSGKKILLIDCDIKNPNIAEKFGLPKYSSGLIDYLTEKTDTPNIYKPIKLSENNSLIMNIDIIPTGEFANISGEILASERMNDLLSNLAYYDFVILDTPPITRLSDALSLGRLVKDTILVVRAGQTVKQSISWAVGELRSVDINFTGLVVNDSEIKKNSYKYQYGYSKA
jgi:tyrosine-protein kinase Etk/Wzc